METRVAIDASMRPLLIEDEMRFRGDRVKMRIDGDGVIIEAESAKDIRMGDRSIAQIVRVYEKMCKVVS
ncbi:MAG: hypothetical protein ABIH41_00195 [Nanoarchaeota archaeon]